MKVLSAKEILNLKGVDNVCANKTSMRQAEELKASTPGSEEPGSR